MPRVRRRGLECLFFVRSYCTFAVTAKFAFKVNVQVLVFAPPLEHAPPQMASRPLATLRVTTVPGATCVLPVLPLQRSGLLGLKRLARRFAHRQLQPVTVGGATTGFSVKVAERVTPPPETDIVASVCVLTAAVLMKNPPVVLPAGIVTEVAVSDAAALLLLIWKTWSVAAGAAMVTVAKVLLIPLTEAGLSAIDAGCPCGVMVSGD